MKTETYTVDKSKYDNYVKSVNQRNLIVALTILGILIAVFVFLARMSNKVFFVIPFVLVVAVVFLGALRWGQHILTKTLLKFKDAVIEFSSTGVSLKGTSLKSRDIPFDKIAVIDTSLKGTVIVKGNFWTKVDYYRPKIGGVSLDFEDRIFIPRIIDDYEELIKKIKNNLPAENQAKRTSNL